MKSRRIVAIAASSCMLPACATLSAQQDLPAVIVDPSEQSRAELQRAVSGALNGAGVTLADDALTSDSVLTIELRAPRDLEARPLAGRALEMPVQFRLVINGSRCVLVRQSDGARTELTAARCRAAAADQ